ncbi:MAG: hypothetical protein ACOX8W_10270 [bacterium]
MQEKRAQHIKLVTSMYYELRIIEAGEAAKKEGLRLSVVYDTICYELVGTTRDLSGSVDIYLIDF